MSLLISAALFIIGLLCCIGISFVVIRERGDERKTLPSPTSSTASTPPSPATPIATEPEHAESQAPQDKQIEPVEQKEHTVAPALSIPTLPTMPVLAEMEQIAQLFQDGHLSPEWWREQFQELSVKVQDMREQSGLIERHIAILNQLAVHMAELEQVRQEYTQLRERRSATLQIPKRLPFPGNSSSDDTYINTEKRSVMKKYPLRAMYDTDEEQSEHKDVVHG